MYVECKNKCGQWDLMYLRETDREDDYTCLNCRFMKMEKDVSDLRDGKQRMEIDQDILLRKINDQKIRIAELEADKKTLKTELT